MTLQAYKKAIRIAARSAVSCFINADLGNILINAIMVLHTGLEGSHMLITGKTSATQPTHPGVPVLTLVGGTRGIGKATVEAFLSEGANVSYCARKVTGEEFSSFATAGGARAVGTSVDVADEQAVIEWVRKSAEEFGRVDTVIANGECSLL